MKRFLVLVGIILFVLMMASRVGSALGSATVLAFLVGVGSGGLTGAAWARTARAHADWRGARAGLPKLRRGVLDHARTLAGVGVATCLAAVVILIMSRSK